MEVEPLLGQNPESYMEGSTATYSGMIRKNQKFANKHNLFEECRTIMNKSYENRIPSENSTLLRLLDKSLFLKELSQNISLDFVKGILRHAKIEIIDEKQVISEENQDLNYMVVVLDGKLGLEKSNLGLRDSKGQRSRGKDTIEVEDMKNDQLFEKLTMVAKKERDLQKTKSKLQRKSSIPMSSYDLTLPVLTDEDYKYFCKNLERNIGINEEYGARQRLLTKSYRNRTAALETTTLLVIEISFLFYWLEAAFKKKLAKNLEMMKKITCFSSLEDQKLTQIILSMKLCKRRKNDVIYYQGGESDMLYILIKGQIKLTKKTSLFKQNPNDLYTDRRKLVEYIHRDDKKYRTKSMKKDNDDVLPFANLTTLYNYRPVNKRLELGIISSFGLFGDEQIICSKPRETSAVVDCLEATYFEIDFKKILEIIGAKQVDNFKKTLENSICKKILYRQSEFADNISFQNQTNLDYFYFQDEKPKESPRKFKLQKLNEKLSPMKKKDDDTHAPAYYTCFNFNKMANKRYSDSAPTKQMKKTANESAESLISVMLNNNQQNLVGISHSWNPIEKKVKQQKRLSKKISPRQHEINIGTPLIDNQYFRDMAKQKQRISKEHRTFILSLGKKLK